MEKRNSLKENVTKSIFWETKFGEDKNWKQKVKKNKSLIRFEQQKF